MPYDVIISADADIDGWLRERQKLLTATDIPSIVGAPGARSALETWYQKKDALVGRAENDAIRQAKQAGHDFEDFNALMFAKAAGRYVSRSQQLIRSREHRWLGCTLDYTQSMMPKREQGLDALALEPGASLRCPLELKNAGSYAAEEMWPLGGEPHLTWQLQVTSQIIVMGVQTGSLSAWLGAPFVHHRWCDIERDERVEEIILDEGEAFWKSLKRKTPAAERPEVAFEILRRLSPEKASRKIISLPHDAAFIHQAICSCEDKVALHKAQLRESQRNLDAARAQMGVLIGENYGGTLRPSWPGAAAITYTFAHTHVAAHSVAAYSYRTLNRVTENASKRKRKTTWKTSK